MFGIKVERERDGRRIADVAQLPGAIAYGRERQDAFERAQSLALRVLAERLDAHKSVPYMAKILTITQ